MCLNESKKNISKIRNTIDHRQITGILTVLYFSLDYFINSQVDVHVPLHLIVRVSYTVVTKIFVPRSRLLLQTILSITCLSSIFISPNFGRINRFSTGTGTGTPFCSSPSISTSTSWSWW